MFTVRKSATFSAAHALRNYEGRCARTHGHDYRVELVIQGRELDHRDLLVDFYDLDAAMASVVERIDHRHLNEIPPFDTVNPSAEAIARWFHDELNTKIQEISGGRATLQAVRLWETPDAVAVYEPGS